VDTPYVFLCDMDFLPSKDMASLLAKQLDLLKEEQRRVLVVPALESEQYRVDGLPLSKAEVLKLMDIGEILTFRSGETELKGQSHEKVCEIMT
jgi:Glycosyl-transferase for dystroglycan